MTPEDARLLADLLREEAEAERERAFGALSARAEPPPLPPVDAPQPEDDPRNVYDQALGYDSGFTQTQALHEYHQQDRRLRMEQELDIGAPDELQQKQRADLKDAYLRHSVDSTGQDVGSAFRSDLLLNTDGYVLGDDGRPRKASGPEILKNGILRQSLSRGPEAAREVARIKEQHDEAYTEARDAGMTHEEAILEVEPLSKWLTGNVNFDTRTIDESVFQRLVTNLGAFATGMSEVVFDEMPLYYEVDANGEMQYPDDPMDLAAYYMGQFQSLRDTELVDTPFGAVSIRDISDTLSPSSVILPSGELMQSAYRAAEQVVDDPAQAVRNIIDGVGTSDDGSPAAEGSIEAAYQKLEQAGEWRNPGGDYVGWIPYYGLKAIKHGTDLIPEAFVAIDRDAPTPDDVEGKRAAAATGSLLGDIGMAIARGRMYYDDLLSIPSYREKLGDDYRLAMLPAFVGEAFTPVAPVKTVGRMLTYLDKVTKGATRARSPAAWGRAFLQHREVSSLFAEGGKELVDADVFTVLRTEGTVLKQATDKLSSEMTTPAALVAGKDLSREEFAGLARQSESAKRILSRSESVGMEQAYYDWRIGLEVEALAQTLRESGARSTERLVELMTNLVENAAGLDAARYLSTSQIYASAMKAAAKGDIAEMFANFKGAARYAGSMGINSTNVRVRQVMRVMDQVVEGRGVADIASTPGQLLAPYLTTARKAGGLSDVFKGLAPAVRTSMETASALHRFGRLALEELLHNQIPRNLQMVTKRTMVPRDMNTPQVMAQVGSIERSLLKAESITDGADDAYRVTSDREVLRNLFREVLPGVGRRGEWLNRSPMYRDIDVALQGDGILTPDQFNVLADTVREAGYRQVLGQRVEVPAVGGREFGLAQRPSVVVNGQVVARVPATEMWRPLLEATVAVLEGTRRAIQPAIPAADVAASNMGAARGFAAAKLARPVDAAQEWLRGGNMKMPAPLKQVMEEVANAMGVISRRFDDEAMAARRAAQQAGSETPGPDALNNMVMRRWTEIGERSNRMLNEAVERMRQEHQLAKQRNPRAVMPSDAELAWLVVYREGGREFDVGRRMRAIAAMDPGSQKLMYQGAKLWLRRTAYKRQWRNLLADFFGSQARTLRATSTVEKINEEVMKYLDPALNESILVKDEARALQREISAKRKDLRGMKGGPQQRALIEEIYNMMDELASRAFEYPTVDGMQRVVQRIRDFGGQQLADRGAARVGLSGFTDALFEASSSWMLSFDQQKAITKIFGEFADAHPELIVNLAPHQGTKAWAQGTLARVYTPVDTVQNVIQALYEKAVVLRPDEADRLTKLYNTAAKRLETPGPASGTGQRPPRPRYYHDPEIPKGIQERLGAAEQGAANAQQNLLKVIDELAETVAATRFDAPLGKQAALPTATGDALRAKALREAGPEAIERARIDLGKTQSELNSVRSQRDTARTRLKAVRKKQGKKKFKDAEQEAEFGASVRQFQGEIDRLNAQYATLTKQVREFNKVISEAAKGLKTRQVQVGRKAARVEKLQAKKVKAEQKVADAEAKVRRRLLEREQYRLDNQVLTRDQTGVDAILRYVDQRMNSLGSADLNDIARQAIQSIAKDQSLFPSKSTVIALRSAGEVGGARGQLSFVEQAIYDMKFMPATGDALHDALHAFAEIVPKQQLKDIVGNVVSETVDYAVNGHVFDTVAQSLRGYGLTSAGHGGAVHDIVSGLARIPERDLAMLPELAGLGDAVRSLQSSARDGRLLSTLSSLQKRNVVSKLERGVTGNVESVVRFAMDVAGTTLTLSRTLVSYGLLSGGVVLGLAGVPVPIPFVSRYIGLNLFSVPSILLGTLGARRTATVLADAPGEAARSLKNLVDVTSPRMPDDVRFVDRYGKTWTERETQALLDEWNWYMSRASVDQSSDLMLTMQRDLRVMVDKEGLKNLPWYKFVQQHLFSPRRTSAGMEVATGMDSVFRRSTFLTAIREGQTPAQAAELARASVLDYGAVPDYVKQTMNRYMLFATFKAASYAEIMRALARGDDAFLRAMRIQQRLQVQADSWAYGEDYDRVRLFMLPAGEIDNRPVFIGGPQDPIAANAAEMIQLTAYFASMTPFTEDGGPMKERLQKVLREQNYMPAAQLAVLSMTQANLTRGRLVPDVWVVRMQQAQYWDQFREMFDIGPPVTRPVLGGRDQRRPNTPTFTRGAVQYEFSPAGYEKWALAQLLATQLTAKRMTEDFTKGQISAGYYPEDYNPKYRGAVGFMPYFIGLGTGLKGKREEDIYQRAYIQTQFLNR